MRKKAGDVGVRKNLDFRVIKEKKGKVRNEVRTALLRSQW
jgi:hypothetical protein